MEYKKLYFFIKRDDNIFKEEKARRPRQEAKAKEASQGGRQEGKGRRDNRQQTLNGRPPKNEKKL